jgi:hypothetical protein
LGDCIDVYAIVYLDDILIFSGSEEEHEKHIRTIVDRLSTADLYGNIKKCSFFQEEIEFLGFLVGRKGVRMDPDRIRTIREWPIPTTYRDIQVFLGFCNFYRRFIRDYSRITRPLNEQLKGMIRGRKLGEIDLFAPENAEARTAFEELKTRFQQAPLLQHYDPTLSTRIESDASDGAAASVISQQHHYESKSQWHPIAFWSRKFSGAELNWTTYDKELSAIVESFKHWRQYLEGAQEPVTVLSDHNNLRGFMKQKELTQKQVRWLMYLAGFDFTIEHRPGKTNPADGPSRRPDYMSEEKPPNLSWIPTLESKMVAAIRKDLRSYPEDQRQAQFKAAVRSAKVQEVSKIDSSLTERWLKSAAPLRGQFITRVRARVRVHDAGTMHRGPHSPLLDLIREAQGEDPMIQTVIERIQSSNGAVSDGSGYEFRDGLLYQKRRICVPEQEALRQEILRTYHDEPLSGHWGQTRTRILVERHFCWPGLRASVADYVRSCATCQYVSAPHHRPYGELASLPIPSNPMQELSMDFVTGLPTAIIDGKEVDAILVIVDRFTKMSFFFPVNTIMNAAELGEIFYREIECKWGPPRGIVTDRGTIFTSKFWKTLCQLSGIKSRYTTAYHPQGDGQTERMNQTLEQYLRAFTTENTWNWPNLLHTAFFACNSAQNATIKMSPFKALFGYEPSFTIPYDQWPTEDSVPRREAPAAEERLEKLQRIRTDCEENWKHAAEIQARNYNERHQPKQFKIGEWVSLTTKHLRLKDKKLAPRRVGPFKILSRTGKQAYGLVLPEKYSRMHHVYHVSQLEPWVARNPKDLTEDILGLPDLEDEQAEWELEEIRDHQEIGDTTYYLIKWKGWPSEYNSWVPEDEMSADETITKYRKGRGLKRNRKRAQDQADEDRRKRPRRK